MQIFKIFILIFVKYNTRHVKYFLTKNLTYQFSETEKVLNNINLEVPKGSIYDFLNTKRLSKFLKLKKNKPFRNF
jgi:hypothetical protein